MKKLIIILLVTSLACGSVTSNIETPSPSAFPAPVPQSLDTVTVTAYELAIRDPNGVATGESYLQGQELRGTIEGNWFVLQNGNKVFIGCVNANSEKGCEAIP